MSNEGERNKAGFSGIPQEWDAFCRFIETHYAIIYSVALAHTRNGDIAQEITQDVCVRLLLEQKKLSQIPNPSGWLLLVARNTAIDWGRRRQRHSRILAMMESWKHDTTKAGYTPADARTAAINEEEKQRLYAALDHIAPEDREIILMHYMDGMEKQEIARLLSLHPSTVGRRMEKAMGELQETLGKSSSARISGLRSPDHTKKSVLATLSAVAVLSASDKMALAAVAAPLPVLSVTANATGSSLLGTIGKSVSKAGNSATHALSGYTLSIIAGIILTGGVVAITQPWNYWKKSDSSSVKLGLAESSHTSVQTLALKQGNIKRTSGDSKSRIMNGLTSIGASSPGYLYPSLDGKTLYGNVRNEEGKPISGALVTLHYFDEKIKQETSQSLVSDAQGAFSFKDIPKDLPKGMVSPIDITAKADGYAHATLGEYQSRRPLPLIREDINIVLQCPVVQRGTITNHKGEPVAHAKVAVIREYDKFQQMYQDGSFRQEIFCVYTDANGEYLFDGLKPGYVALKVEHSEYARLITNPIESTDQSVKLQLDRGVTLIGRVHDGETTLSNALVKIEGPFIGIRSSDSIDLRTDLNGQFQIDHLALLDPNLDSWPYTARLQLPNGKGWLSYGIRLNRGQTSHTVMINAQDPRMTKVSQTLWTVFADEANSENDVKHQSGLASLTAIIEKSETDPSRISVNLSDNKDFYASKQSSESGEILFSGIKPGTYLLTCSFKDKMKSLSVDPIIVHLSADQNQKMFLKNQGNCSVFGKLLGAPHRTTCTIEVLKHNDYRKWIGGALRRVASIESGIDGSFLIDDLPAGDYVLVAKGLNPFESQSFSCRNGERVQCNLTQSLGNRVTGSLYDSSTSKPVAHGKIRISPVVERELVKTQNITADANGHFEVNLTSGSYNLHITAFNQSWTCTTTIDIKDNTNLIPIDVNRQTGGIVVHAQAGSGQVAWRQAWIDLHNNQDDADSQKTDSNSSWLSLDGETQILSKIEAGSYGVTVRYSHDVDTTPDAFATVYIPNIKVQPDLYTILNVPLESASFVTLLCEPGHHLLSWNRPKFWLKDDYGTRMPMKLKDSYLSFGLAPGAYTFGVTLDSGEQQSVDFRVSALVEQKEVILQLK